MQAHSIPLFFLLGMYLFHYRGIEASPVSTFLVVTSVAIKSGGLWMGA